MKKTSAKEALKNSSITLGILGAATMLCFLVRPFSQSDTHVPLLFVLAVFFISRLTDGYFYGFLGSVIGVVGVNYVFTYPYFEINFTITGYPLTFAVMLAVAFSVSALTTQIKEQEELRLEAEKEKVRGNLLRAVSHDIRTPLTSIVGSASWIIENYEILTKENLLELLDNIRTEAQWLVRIVENLLSITRIGQENGCPKLDKQEELAEEIVSGAVEKFRKRFPEVKVTARLPEEVLLVPMDGILMEQVLVNLMENAVYHGKGMTGIWIDVRDEGENVRFAVEDDGCGIKESVLPRMFDGNLRTDSEEGGDSKRNMGIGLSVCRSIVKVHGGTMKAENRKEGGARILFWLPKGTESGDGD